MSKERVTGTPGVALGVNNANVTGAVLVVGGKLVHPDLFEKAKKGCSQIIRTNFSTQHSNKINNEQTHFYLNDHVFDNRKKLKEEDFYKSYNKLKGVAIQHMKEWWNITSSPNVRLLECKKIQSNKRINAFLKKIGYKGPFLSEMARCGHASIIEIVRRNVFVHVVGFSDCKDIIPDNSTYYNSKSIQPHFKNLNKALRAESLVLCWLEEHGYIRIFRESDKIDEIQLKSINPEQDIYESVKYEGAVFSGPRDMVSRMKKGKYEKEEIDLLNKMKFTSDDVVLELGGCLGIVSVITNKILQKLSGGIPRHKVVEANPELLSILKENKSKNKATFDIVHGLVSLDSDGSFYAYDKAVAGSAHRLDNKEKNKREYKVPVLHPSIFADTTVLIMDIEGGELQALQEILPLCPKIRLIMVEIHEFLMYKGFGKKVETLLRSNQFKRSKKLGITYVYERN